MPASDFFEHLLDAFFHWDDIVDHWRALLGVVLIIAGVVAIWLGHDGRLGVAAVLLYVAGGLSIVAGIWLIFKHIEDRAM